MPNHITNILYVKGRKKDVEAFRDKVYRVEKATEKTWNHNIGDDIIIFDFEKTVPMPESMHITCPARTDEEKKIYAENKAKYGAGDWYEWAIKNFGTKWGAYDAEKVEPIKGGMIFRFLTAWSPPAQWFVTTAKQFPKLKFIDYWQDEGGGSGKITLYTEGSKVRVEDETLSDHEWLVRFNEDYKKEYNFITKGSYKKVLDSYAKIEEPEWNNLNEFLLKRLKDKDLPLFIHFEWYHEQRNFEARLKAGSKD